MMPERYKMKARLGFVIDAYALDALCNPAAATELQAKAELMRGRDRRNFLDGYRLAVATPLLQLVNFVVSYAELLGLEHDSRLWNWWEYGDRHGGAPITSAVSDPSCGIARLCSTFDHLMATLRISDRRSRDYGLAETVSAVGTVGAFASLICNAVTESAIVLLDTGEIPEESGSLFKLCIIERVSDYMNETPHYSSAYHLVWRHKENWQPVEDESVMRAGTTLETVFSLPRGRAVPTEWAKGLGFGFDTVLLSVGIDLTGDSKPGEFDLARWLSTFRHVVDQFSQDCEWPSLYYGASEFDQSSVDRALAQMDDEVVTVSPRERLAAILGPDRVHLQTSAASADFFDFELLLTGMVSKSTGNPVQVLRVTHSVEDDSRDWVSYAIRSPLYGPWSNLSKWYLFYKMYHEGFIGDSDVARAIREVEALLLRFDDDLEVEDLADVSDADLLSYCNSQVFDSMKALNRKAIQANEDLRNRYSELLAGLWLHSTGYDCAKVSLKRESLLGKYEYDAVGVKDGRCLVVEVKGGGVVDNDLRGQIVRLDKKVRHLQSILPALQQVLGCGSPISNVAGLFISLANLRDFDPGRHDCELWDRDRFVAELKAVGLPNKITDLLDKSYIIRSDGLL